MTEPTASDTETNALQGTLAMRRYGLPMGIFVGRLEHDRCGGANHVGIHCRLCGQQPVHAVSLGGGRHPRRLRGLCVAELAAALPSSGGDYIYLYEAYGPLAAFLTGWVSFLIGFAAPIAASAFASASYLLAPLAWSPRPARLANQALASVAIVAFALIHTSKASACRAGHTRPSRS